MLLFLSVLSEILLGLSVLIGLILFRVIAKDIIPLVALLFLTCIFEMISFLLMKNGVHNHFLPNILTLIEFDVCSYMLWLWLRETKFSIIIPYLATFFSLFWLITTFFVLNFSETNNYTGIMQSVLMIILALVLAFHITRRTKKKPVYSLSVFNCNCVGHVFFSYYDRHFALRSSLDKLHEHV